MLRTANQLLRFRSLLATLTAREVKARYRGSVLGFLWSLVNPLLLLAVYTAVFGFIFQPPRGEGVEPYALFLITGLFPWMWFSASLLEGAMAMVANAGLIRKAVFPVELPPVVVVLANLVHFLLALPVLAAALVVGHALGYAVGGWAALVLPGILLLQLLLTAGLALAVAALNSLFKDVRDLLGNLLTLGFFLAPILYPLDFIGFLPLRWLVLANPFTPFALAYQAALFHGRVPAAALWLHMLAVSLLAWTAGSWIFQRLRQTLVEVA